MGLTTTIFTGNPGKNRSYFTGIPGKKVHLYMKLHIPNSAFIGNIEAFIKTFEPTPDTQLEITTNQSWISVHPMVISMVIALTKEMQIKNGSITSDEFSAKSRPYLQRMGLIDAINPSHNYQIDEHEASGRFIPARQIRSSDELNQFITDMVPLLHTTPEQAYPIKYVMSELVRNVLEHSDSGIGAIVSAQYFKKTNRISIGVADRGKGVRTAINQSHSAITHKDALALALKPGITGTTRKIGGTEFNAGAGLFFTKSIAKVSRDFFIIYSGDSFFKLLKTNAKKNVKLYASPHDDRANFQDNLPYWQGTCVGIDISLDINQDFQELLEMIRNAYHLNVKRENKKRYRKPKFI